MTLTPSALSSQYPFLVPPTSIDYTSRDWASLVSSMLSYANTAFPAWNTNSEGDFGVIMLELFAYMGDILSYYGDRISQEAYLPTATQRLSLLNIASMLGYIPSNGVPASGTVTFQTVANGPPVTVPAGTQVSTQNSVNVTIGTTTVSEPAVYETQADVVVPGNGGTASVTVLQGETQADVPLGTSDGTPGQQFTIPQLGVIDGTTSVAVQTSTGTEQWVQVPYLVDAGPTDKVYQVKTNSDGSTIIVFGDNLNGMIPALNMTITVSYRIGIGSAGNVPAGSVSTIDTSTVTGVSIPLLADGVTYNSSAMTGGADAESNDQIRANAPSAFRAQYRAVGVQDFADLALNVPGVMMASAIAGNSTSVSLYVLGPDYGLPGPVLVDNILTYFADKTLAGTSLSVVNPSIINVDVGSTAAPVQLMVKPGYSAAVVQNNVQSVLQAFFTPPNAQFGQLITISDLYTAVMGVAGVLAAIIPVMTREDMIQTGTASIQFRDYEVPAAGNFYFTTSGGM